MLTVFTTTWYWIFTQMQEPWRFKSVSVESPIVKVGEPVVVTYYGERLRMCTTEISEFWLDDKGAVLARGKVPGGYASLGGFKTRVLLRHPLTQPGDYIYRSAMDADCGLFKFQIEVPDVHFRVVE
jgi:hypothetical protein